MTDVLIIGAGPAGLTAAIYAARAGLTAKVFDKNMYGGQLAISSEIENYPSVLKADGVELATNMYTHATSLGTEVVFEEVTGLDVTGDIKKVTTTANTYEGKTIILAGGAARRKLNVPGEAEFFGQGVSYCATCDGAFYRDKTVAIVGGGNTALEDALFLSNNCKKVYLIHRRDEFRGEQVLQDAVFARDNIEIIYSATVASIEGEGSVRQCTVNTKEGQRTLDINGIFVAVGLIPESALFKDMLPLSAEGYVEADESCTTSIPGVFVAGDIRTKPLRQIVTACADGATAAVAAATYLGADASASLCNTSL